jgi:rare lipoprotein A
VRARRTSYMLLVLMYILGVAVEHGRVRTVVVTQRLPPGLQRINTRATYGWASWYGKPFHGRKTADGTIYDMGGYSVAHKTLALGTFVRIKNTRSGAWCVAIVNDRGPYVEGRDWDVSRAVAKRLGMVKRGVIPVEVEIIR